MVTDNTTLENSISEEAARAIAAIKEKEALEIRHLDETYAMELKSFKKQIEAETEGRLLQEVSRLENRSVLERRKFKLQSVEQFVKGIVGDVIKEIRNHPNYRQFLTDTLVSMVKQFPVGAEVRLKPDDLVWEKEILTAVEGEGSNRKVVIKGDPGILWGGCLVVEEKGGRIFNNTIERIYFRKSLLIRQKVMKILTEHSRDEKNQNIPKAEV